MVEGEHICDLIISVVAFEILTLQIYTHVIYALKSTTIDYSEKVI